MDDATFFVLIVGGFLIAFGAFSLFFCSNYAQRKFNPNNEPWSLEKPKIIVDNDYRVRPK